MATPQHQSKDGRPAAGSRAAAIAAITKAKADVKAQVAKRAAATQSGHILSNAFDTVGHKAGTGSKGKGGHGGGKGNPNHGAGGRFA